MSKIISIKNATYGLMAKENEGRITNPDTSGPSAIANCQLQHFNYKTGLKETNPMDQASLFKTSMGKWIHQPWLEMLKANGIINDFEVEGRAKLFDINWHFFVDGVADDFVLELKTVYAGGFRALETNGLESKEGYVFQTIIYMEHHQKPGIITFGGRDNGFMMEYVLEYSKDKLLINGEQNNILHDSFHKHIDILKDTQQRIKDNHSHRPKPLNPLHRLCFQYQQKIPYRIYYY